MEINSGRYKLGLISLKKATDADATQAAILKATALQQTGRRKQAIEALSQSSLAKDVRAQILARMCWWRSANSTTPSRSRPIC